MQINKKTQLSIMIAGAVLGALILFKSGLITDDHKSTKQKPVFFNRMPTNIKKVRQHINIDIDYVKLPARNEIRLTGKVNTKQLKNKILDYKWTLKDNLVLKRGSISGKLDLRNKDEVSIDVAIKDMSKKINVRLEASAETRQVKIGASQNFTYDPSMEPLLEAERAEAQTKAHSLSKKDLIEQELQKRKPTFQQ